MPPDVHTALTSATRAANHLRARLASLARAVAENEPAAIVAAARALAARDEAFTANPTDSPDRPGTNAGVEQGESS